MAERHFGDLLGARFSKGFLLCVGLDSDLEVVPEAVQQSSVQDTLFAFNRAIIDATQDLVCAFKLNSAFYEAHGDIGVSALRESIQYIHDHAPEVSVILDSKRADIGNTNRYYADYFFSYLNVDAITVPPLLGSEALQPFLERGDKGIFVLCRTSNQGAGEFQDLLTDGTDAGLLAQEPLYKIIAKHVAEKWNMRDNCGLVVGATYPEQLKIVRSVAPKLPILLPGVGAQQGDLQKSVRAGKDAKNAGLIVSASRAVIFASSENDFADAARIKAMELHGKIGSALLE